jgi:hypothetical protein
MVGIERDGQYEVWAMCGVGALKGGHCQGEAL